MNQEKREEITLRGEEGWRRKEGEKDQN